MISVWKRVLVDWLTSKVTTRTLGIEAAELSGVVTWTYATGAVTRELFRHDISVPAEMGRLVAVVSIVFDGQLVAGFDWEDSDA